MERPWRNGKFIITAGLKPLEGRPVFAPENNLSTYIANKQRARAEDLSKHYPLPVGLSELEMEKIARVLRERLSFDWPDFRLKEELPHRDPVDLIISQVPEDFSVWKMEDGREWLALIHLSSANHWDARKKNGKSFFASHGPVPHIDAISKAAPKMFEQIQKRGAVERFAWGVATDDRLNHHPEPPPEVSEDVWKGRSFDLDHPELYVRMERQTLFPIDEKMIGFTIKTSFTNVLTLPKEDLMLIRECISGMDEEILKYKGLIHDKDNILFWLSTLIEPRDSVTLHTAHSLQHS